jgi:predicted SnoaL-like aldol condensation-catalyzing enzyme
VLTSVVTGTGAHCHVPPVANQDQQAMLRSSDARLARNKRTVFDWWRIVFEGGHMEQAAQFMAESYVQHNPNIASGRSAFVEFFGKVRPPRPVGSRINAPVVAITAEGNIVTISTLRRLRDPADPEHLYDITWFDMFRIDSQGRIAEHWDPSALWIEGKPPGAEFLPR